MYLFLMRSYFAFNGQCKNFGRIAREIIGGMDIKYVMKKESLGRIDRGSCYVDYCYHPDKLT